MAVSGRIQGPPQDGDIEQYSRANGQWVLTQNPTYPGSVTFVDGNGVTRAQIDSISGDLWLLSNAYWNPNDSTPTGNFYRVDRTHAAFGLQLQGQGFIPGEPNLGYYVAGCTVWVAQPENYDVIRGGGIFANPIFNVVGGWELGTTVTQQRQLTVGGGGIEVDGYGLLPYGRFVNNDTGTVLHKHLIANVENAYTDLSGYDDPTQESWVWGFVQEYNPSSGPPYPMLPGTTRWSVAYIPANTPPTSGVFYEYLKITPQGPVAIAEVTQNPTTNLGIATKQYTDTSISTAISTVVRVIGSVTGPATQQTATTTPVNFVSVTANLVAGRKYRIAAQALISQQTATGTPAVNLIDNGAGYIVTGQVRVVYFPSLAATVGTTGNAFWYIQATSSAAVTFSQSGSTSAGTLQVAANNMQLTVEDVGA